MTLSRVLQDAAGAAKKIVVDNMTVASEETGTVNPFGDHTLVLDKRAEDAILQTIGDSGIPFAFLTEERGLVSDVANPEYLAVIDPVDGSVNLGRGIPLCSTGIAAIPYGDSLTTDDIEVSVIGSIFTDEVYVAERGRGVRKNGRTVRPSGTTDLSKAIVSYDTNRSKDGEFGEGSCRTIVSAYDIRRTGTNLLDLCWVAAGMLDAMVDLRDVLAVIHVSGAHMVFESGAVMLDRNGGRFLLPIDMSRKMSFVAAGTEELARAILARFDSVTR